MALETNELFASRSFSGRPRMVVEHNAVGTFAVDSSARKLLVGTPISHNGTDWVPYAQPADAAIFTITDQSGGTDGGSFDLIVDGLQSTHAWNVTAAAMQAELLALFADAGKSYTVACACSEASLGVAAAIMTLTFSESAGAPSVEIDTSLLTDGGVAEPANLVLATSDAGTQLVGHKIRGFVAHSDVQLSATDEVQGDIMIAGEIHRDDINTAAFRALCDGSPSEAELDTALRAIYADIPTIRVRGLSDAIK